MQVYASFTFFLVMAVLLVPVVIVGFTSGKLKLCGMIFTAVFLAITFSTDLLKATFLLSYIVLQIIIMKFFLHYRLRVKKVNSAILKAVILLSILPIFIVKITPFFGLSKVGFLGISYLTFKCVQVLLEISDGIIKQMKLKDYLYFVLFFPTLTSGPIDRSRRFFEDSNKKYSKKEYSDLIGSGLYYIILGATYKFVFASFFYGLLNGLNAPGLFTTIKYMYIYGFNLFFDFAGYSLMAVGTSYILGVNTPQNFNLPFISTSIKEFWDRWHITLSHWFRDYLYTRVLMSFIRKKRFKSRYTASYVAYIINMGIMGLWHGIDYKYVVYGLYHAMLLILNDLFERKVSFFKINKDKLWYKIIAGFITFNLVMFGFLIFSGRLF